MRNKSIASMTMCYNEESTVAFTIGSCLDCFDYVVMVDTGSEDKSVSLIKSLFSKDIESGKLILHEIPKLENWDISVARKRALATISGLGCDYFVKADADEVFDMYNVIDLITFIETLPPVVNGIITWHHELYQEIANTRDEFLDMLKTNDGFWEMVPESDYNQMKVFRVKGATCMGKWTDEAKGLRPEGTFYKEGYHAAMLQKQFSTHYGWARPIAKKIEKAKVWRGPDGNNVGIEKEDRIKGLFETNSRKLAPFRNHPPAIEKYIDDVLKFFKGSD